MREVPWSSLRDHAPKSYGLRNSGCSTWVTSRGGRKVRLIDHPIPIRSSDCIGRYNRLMPSSDFCIGRLYRFVLSSDSLIGRSCFLVLSSDFCIWRFCRSVLSFDSLINRSCFLVLSSDFCIVRLCRPVLSKKSLYRYWERRLWAVWWSFIIWPRIYTDSQHMTIYTMLNIPRTRPRPKQLLELACSVLSPYCSLNRRLVFYFLFLCVKKP